MRDFDLEESYFRKVLDGCEKPTCHPRSRWIPVRTASGAIDPELQMGECQACRDSLDEYRAGIPIKPGMRVLWLGGSRRKTGVVLRVSAIKADDGGWRDPHADVKFDDLSPGKMIGTEELQEMPR